MSVDQPRRPDESPRQYPVRSSQPKWRFSSSGLLTPFLILLLCAGLLFAAYEHGKGHLHQITSSVLPQAPPPPSGDAPGGEPPIRLARTATSGGALPEFLSATLLPGRGMQILQITAAVPGHGEVPLLFAPALQDAGRVLTGDGDDADGDMGVTVGGAFMFPWARKLRGTPGMAPGILRTNWDGLQVSFPAASADSSFSVHGLFLKRKPDAIQTSVLADGQSLHAEFHPGDFKGMWPSPMDVTLDVELTGHVINLTLTAKNTGNLRVPVGAGWHPLFAVPSGNRLDALLTIPSGVVDELDHTTGLPTGRSSDITDSPHDFQRAGGTALGAANIDETYINLRKPIGGDGPICELRDPGDDLALRLIPLTANIDHVHVMAPLGKPWVAISPETNADDPFGGEWLNEAGSGIVTLQPGATFTYKVRLEISTLNGTAVLMPASAAPAAGASAASAAAPAPAATH